MVWGWFGVGLAWFGSVLVGGTVVFSKDSAWFGLGLGLVWLGLAMCVFCEILTFSNRIAWFGVGLAGFGLVLVGGTVVFFKNVVTYALCRLQLQPSTFIQLDTYVCE